MPILQVNQVNCQYAGHTVVNNASFSLKPGQIACLLGPSGSGKTTLLRAIAGLETITAGSIALRGEIVSTAHAQTAPEKRRIGMVFQDYALFPHLTAAENVAFGLRKQTRATKLALANNTLASVGLDDLGARYPHELSGGQQQRVALARALAPEPDLILMDEPFSGLDLDLRERLGRDLHARLHANNIAALVVTHDQHEAFALGDEVGVLRDGKIEQWAAPYTLYHEPANRFVADFIGQGCFIAGQLTSPTSLRSELGPLMSRTPFNAAPNASMDILLRPDDLIPAEDGPLGGTIIKKAFKGAEIMYTLRLDSGSEVLALFPSHANHQLGEQVRLSLDTQHVVAFPSN